MVKKEYVYYWYDHMARFNYPKLVKEIENSIENHNFKKFLEFYNSNDNGIKYFLPNTAAVFTEFGLLEHVNILEEENFNKITYSEYECG